MSYGRTYFVHFQGSVDSELAVWTITAGSNMAFEICEVCLGMTSVTDPEELQIQFIRAYPTLTPGSGGSVPDISKSLGTMPSATFTARMNDDTLPSSSVASDILLNETWQLVHGYRRIWTMKDCRFQINPGQALWVFSTPGPVSAHASYGTLTVKELL